MRVVAIVVVAGLVLSGLGLPRLGGLLDQHARRCSRSVTAFSFPSRARGGRAGSRVERASEDTAATCVLTAIADDHAVVGEREITVDSGPTTQVLDVSIETERRGHDRRHAGLHRTPEQTRPR